MKLNEDWDHIYRSATLSLEQRIVATEEESSTLKQINHRLLLKVEHEQVPMHLCMCVRLCEGFIAFIVTCGFTVLSMHVPVPVACLCACALPADMPVGPVSRVRGTTMSRPYCRS